MTGCSWNARGLPSRATSSTERPPLRPAHCGSDLSFNRRAAYNDLSCNYEMITSTMWAVQKRNTTTHHITTVLWPLFQDHPGEPVPLENFWTLWCTGRLTEADTSTIQLGATPLGLSSAHLHHPPFLQTRCPSCRPTNSVKALKATRAFGLGRRR